MATPAAGYARQVKGDLLVTVARWERADRPFWWKKEHGQAARAPLAEQCHTSIAP